MRYPDNRIKTPVAIAGIIVLLACVGGSIWFDLESDKIIGPNRLVAGPAGSVYIRAYHEIYVLWDDGTSNRTLNIGKDLDIHEPVADFYVNPDGGLWVGLQDSQRIRLYSPEGDYLRDYNREASPVSPNGARDFRFSRNPGTGYLYVSDTFQHQIQVYNGSEEQVENLTEFSGKTVRYPGGILYRDGSVYVADRDRERFIVLSGLGDPEQEIHLDSILQTERTYPLRFSINNGNIVILSRAMIPLPGQDVYIIHTASKYTGGGEIVPESAVKIRGNTTGIDFMDVLARKNDILVADPNAFKILRYSPEGEPMGAFGDEEFLKSIKSLRDWKRNLTILRIASLVAAVSILVWFLIAYKKSQNQ
jgi:hypothetical protein